MKPAAHLAAPGRQADRLPTTIGDEAVELFAERALLWTRMRTLFVADVHLGKAAAFRAGGVPVPRGSTAADLARLAALVDASGAQRLVVLGDFLHAKAGVVPALDAAFLAWRDAHPSLAITLVRGNHDANAGRIARRRPSTKQGRRTRSSPRPERRTPGWTWPQSA